MGSWSDPEQHDTVTIKGRECKLQEHSTRRGIMQWASLSFACLVMCLNFESVHCFLGKFENAHSVLGADLDSNIDLKTGFVSGEDSRTNIYGEVSTVKYHLKPNEHMLKLLLDEASACFDIQCRGSQVLMRSKFELHDVPACVNLGISSFTSSSHTTGRLLRFDMQRRPSLNDLQKGDFVHSDIACALPGQQLPTGARRIVSIDRLSDTDKASKNTVFLINTREAHLTDAVSQGSFEFRTENILTVNELPRKPNFQTRWELANGARRISLLNLNWNFDEDTAKAATKINIYSSKSEPAKDKASSTSSSYAVSLDCVNCFSSLKADLFLFYSISASLRSGLSIAAKAEITVRFVANLDFEFSADAAFKFSPKPISLAKLKPLMEQALVAMRLFRSFFPLRVSFGMDISMGVDFEFKAKMKATIGADAQCNYRFGFYLNMPRPKDIDGCSYKLHQPTFSASGTIEIRPYILVVPYVKLSLGPFYGKATTTVRPTLNIYVTVGLATTPPSAPKSLGSSLSSRSAEDAEDNSDSDGSGSAISATFDAGVDLLIPVHLTFSLGYEFEFWFNSFSRDYEIAKYELANFKVPLITSKSSRAPSSLPPPRPPPPPPSPGICTCNVPCGCCNCLNAIKPPMFDIRTSVSRRSLQQLNSPKVQSAFVYIPVQSRFESNPNVAMLLSFVPTTSIHPTLSPGLITVTYPQSFFTSGPSSPSVSNPSNIDGLGYTTIRSATQSSTSFVIHVDRIVPSNKVFIVTLYGLALGPPTSGSSTGITVQTAVDAVSEGISSGSIFPSKLMDVGLEIDYMHRVQNKTPVPIVLKFTTFAPLPSVARLTFTFPIGFFSSGPTTSRSNIAGLDTVTLQPATAVSTSFIISINSAGIAGYSNVVITFAGMAMGAATYGQKSGCTLRSSADSLPSDAFDSGFILLQPVIGQVMTPRLFKTTSHYDKFFFSGNNISSMRLQFTSRSRMHAFSSVRIQFPAGYFVAGPVAASCSLGAFTVVQQPVSFLSNSSIILQTKKSVASFTFVIITLHGVSLGSATANAPLVTLSTSSDVVPAPVSGFMPILPLRCVTFVGVYPDFPSRPREGEYIHGLTMHFHAQTSMSVGGKITISFPPLFFNRSATEPTAWVGIGSMADSATISAVMTMTSTSIVIVSPVDIPVTASVFASSPSTSVRIMLRQLYIGTAASSSQADFFHISTDADPVPSPHPISTNFKMTKRFQISVCQLFVKKGRNIASNTINATLRFETSQSSQNLIPARSGTSNVRSDPIASVVGMPLSSILLEVVHGLPAGQHTVTLEGMRLGAPSDVVASGITVSTSFDYASTRVPSPAIGGQVTGVNFTIAPADRIPHAIGKTVTFTFTTATSIPNGGTITLSYPVYRGYFHFLKSRIGGLGLLAPKIVTPNAGTITDIGLFTTDVGDSVKQGHIILTVGANPIPAGPQIVVLGDVTLGAPTPGSADGITVSTSSDFVSVGAASGALGGQVTNITLTIAQSDRVPRATNKQVTIYFATESALEVNDVIDISYPEDFFGQGITPTLLPMTYTLPNGTTSNSLLSDTISVDRPTALRGFGFRVLHPLSARSSWAILLGGMTMGAPTAGSATGITVQTTKDYSAVGVASGALGGSVSTTTMYFNTQPKPNVTVPATSFNFITETFIPVGGQITIFYPVGLFATGMIPDGIFPPHFTITATDSKFLLVTTGVISPGQVHITCTGLRLGPRPLKATGYTVSTSVDRAPPTSWVSQIGGDVTNVGLFIAPADRIPHATGKTVTFAFTTATDLVVGDSITLTYPIGFFATGISHSNNLASCGILGICVGVTELSSLVINVGKSALDVPPFPAGQHAVILTGMTLGPPSAATTSGITVSTSMDVVSVGGPSPAIGGQVTGVNFTIAPADRIPHATGKTVTFTFTTATSIPATFTTALRYFITLAYPVGMFSNSTLPTIASNAVTNNPVVKVHIALPTRMFMSGPIAASPLQLQSASQTSIVMFDPSAIPAYKDAYEIDLFGIKLDSGSSIDYSKVFVWTNTDPEPSSCVWGEYGSDGLPFLQPIQSGSVINPVFEWEDNLKGTLVGYDRENSRVAMRKLNFTVRFLSVAEVIGNVSIRVPSGLFAGGPMFACITSACSKTTAVTRHSNSFSAVSQSFDTLIFTVPSGHTFPDFRVSLNFYDVVIGTSYHGEAGMQITTDSNPFDSKSVFIQTIVPNCVFPPVLSIPSELRQSGRTPVSITISFIAQSDLPSGSTVTVSFPPFLFADGPQSRNATSTSSSASISNISVRTVVSVSDSPSASFFVIETSGSLMPKFSFISIFLDGMTIGNPMNNTPNSVRITTSSDTVSCIGADTGVILRPPSQSPTADEDGKAPCACKTLNSSIAYNSANLVGSIQTNSQNWTILNASQVDTCDFSLGNVAAFTTIFVFPLTGFYSMHATLSNISTEAKFSSWNFMARIVEASKGNGCCGSTAFCGTLRFSSPHWIYPRLFMRAGDTMSIVWSTEALSNLAHAADIAFSIQAKREPVVYVDTVKGKSGNRGTFDEPVFSLQEGLFKLAELASSIQLPNMTATLLVHPSIYNQNNPHIPHINTGFIIPEYLKNIPLLISSLVSQRATTNYNAFQEQNYCNYHVNNCTSQSRFFETSYATAFDTEIAANRSVSGRAFTLKNVFSLTLQGFTVQNFKNRGDGGAFHLTNSSLILKNCIFSNNFAGAYGSGGAVFATHNSLVLVQGSIFLGHRARGSGGVIYANGGSVVAIEGSIFQDALAESLGGCVYFESSLHPAQFTSSDTKFYQAAASRGAAIAIVGRHSSDSTSNFANSFITSSDFSGLSASVNGGSILLLNASAQISLCGFSNSFSLSGAACVDSIGSTVALSANSYNFTGRPQNFAREASNVTEENSYYSNGGNFCPIPSCTPAVLNDGNCNPVCNVSLCNFDGGDCLCPIEQCPLSSRGNGICDIGCATAGCLYDSGDCCDVEVCPFNLRLNKVCDAECNSRACNYDDGDCTVPVAAKNVGSQRFAPISHVNISRNEGIQLAERHAFLLEKLHFQSKFRSPSVLATAADSQVLRSIHHLRRSSIRESILSNDAQNSRFRTSGIDSVQDPSAVKCVSSSFLVKNTYIEPDPRNFATQGQLCLGLTTCTSCDACSVCSSAGCDSSYSDEVCRAEFGLSSRCIVLQPSAAKNFSKLDCYRIGAASALISPNEETALLSAWIWVAILIGGLLCVGAVTYIIWRYRKQELSIANNVNMSLQLSNNVTIASGSPPPTNMSSMTPPASIPGRSTRQSRLPQDVDAMRATSLATSSVSPPFSDRLVPAQSSISPLNRTPPRAARAVSSDAAAQHVTVAVTAFNASHSPRQPVSSVTMSSVIPDPIVSGSSVSPPVSARPVAQPAVSSPAQSASNATKPVANLLSPFSPNVQQSPPPLNPSSMQPRLVKASSSTSPARSFRAIPPSVSQTFLHASILNSGASSAAHPPPTSVSSAAAFNAVSESSTSAQPFHPVAAAASILDESRGPGAFRNVAGDWDEDVYDSTPPRRPDTEPVLPRPRTPRLQSLDVDSSLEEEFAVFDDDTPQGTIDGLQASQPVWVQGGMDPTATGVSGIAASAAAAAVEAELEELRSDFDAAATMAAAALATELEDLRQEADV